MTKKTFVFVVLVLWGIYPFAQTSQASSDSIPFAPAVNYLAGDGPCSIFCADLDGDGDLDLAVANGISGNVSVLKNNGDGTFQTKVDYPAGYPNFIFCADLNGDNDLDLAVARASSDSVSVLMNNGHGTFELDRSYAVGDHPASVFCADLDGDADLDLVTANEVGDNISVLRNDGNSRFTIREDYPAGDEAWLVFCADLDGTLGLDIVVTNANSSNPTVSVLKNSGDGTFPNRDTYPVANQPWYVFCADLDRDADLDLALSIHYSNRFSILTNNGDGTFQLPASTYPVGNGPVGVFSADLDGDNDMDVVVTNRYSDNVSIFTNNGSLTFVRYDYAVVDGPYSVFCADLDGDMDLDIVTANIESDNVSVLINLSTMVGATCGTITHDNGNPVANVTVKVIDSDNNQVGAPIVTGSDGTFYFDSLLVGSYSVMIVTPLGYSVSPGETQNGIQVTGYPCTEVNFVLTPTMISNNCRTIGYWKHQFDVYVSGRGQAQENSAQLEDYLDLVHLHFNVLGIYIDLENFDFQDAKNVLTVQGGRLMEDRAKQQLFALLLNFASGRIGNETVVSKEGRVAAEAVTYVASLIKDGDPANDELAKSICDLINNSQLVESGIIPASSKRYKFAGTGTTPTEYALDQNYPNPFNPTSEIKYNLPTNCHVSLGIYNVLGQKVRVLANEYQDAGYKSVTWDVKDDRGQKCASGIYFYRLEAGEFSQAKKMVLIK